MFMGGSSGGECIATRPVGGAGGGYPPGERMTDRDPRPRVLQFGGPGCLLAIIVTLMIVWLLRKFIFFVLALGFAAIVLFFAIRAGARVLGYRTERCPGCRRRMIVRAGSESTRCPGCGMIHVFPDSVPRE